jgi:hypothetical protein
MDTSLTKNQSPPHASQKTGRNCANLPEDRPIYYRSDADMSEDEIILGLMEISALSLPDEPHKYHSSERAGSHTRSGEGRFPMNLISTIPAPVYA